MNPGSDLKFLFIINPGSGTNRQDWPAIISNYFNNLNHTVKIYQLHGDFSRQTVIEQIVSFLPDTVVAVGGDGTIKLIAECLVNTKVPLGIIPAGSANGLAKELDIPEDYEKALNLLVTGVLKKIHLLKINNQICIHLSDIGLNAHAVKKFETLPGRGMWGYIRASLKVLRINPMIKVEIALDNKVIKRKAHMIVVANATRYGSGALINPLGKLDDDLFEVVIVKKISLGELFKMIFSHNPYDSNKTEIFQTTKLTLRSARKVYFQIDGEYIGKVNEVQAMLLPFALEIIVPPAAG
ncbi:diacylglycerol kinase [Chryseotalea sanaruensis]|uniref:Diacylglycerol kinase n=2 Tax=Chryseotalea sanaruensis TaxID=2482724 RepID=A0A401U6J3_9BACT|nr:diacylglycerol kinase [Chryseotalea sanaruensis]